MFTTRPKSKTLSAVLCALLLTLPFAASAQEAASDMPEGDLLPAQSVLVDPVEIDQKNATHPPIYITPDKSQILKVDEDIGTIIIGNADHINVLNEDSKTLVLISRLPGASSFQVLNKDGKVIMQRHVIVGTANEDKYVRIRRSCNANLAGKAKSNLKDCQQMSLYYCPDMCHDIRVKTEERVREEEKAQLAVETKAQQDANEQAIRDGSKKSVSGNALSETE